MIPSGGWESESRNTNGPVFASDLPIPHDCIYTEGGDGTIQKESALGFLQSSIEFIESVVLPAFGSGLANARTMRITLRQPRVFGVLLLDSFTPPLVGYEFFDVVPFTQDVCLTPAFQGFSAVLSGCAVGVDKTLVNVTGIDETFTKLG
jgi:hypothetical protein